MIRLLRIDPSDERWVRWRERAKKATEEMIARVLNGEKPTIDEKLYKEPMDDLLKLTKNKCAYCESYITSTHRGDVEHYRPKGRIKEEDGRVVRIASGDDHPGYWWLAYEWTNLLPSCIDCNRRRWHDESLGGKGELFPVLAIRAATPDQVQDEEPLLLNPFDPSGIDPSTHFEFLADGKIKPKTMAGEITCRVLGLNVREGLVTQRSARYKEAQRALHDLFNRWGAGNPNAPSQEEISTRDEVNAMWAGDTIYGAFTHAALEAEIVTYARRGLAIHFPLP